MSSNMIVMALAGLSFCSWAVSLGGLAALQDSCGDTFNPSLGSLPCYRAFRWEWFIICFEFVTVVAILATVAMGAYAKYRQSLLGWTAMVTLLYIIIADRWYTFSNANLSGDLEDRVNTMAAGTIMVSAINCLLVFALGMSEEAPQPSVEAKANAV